MFFGVRKKKNSRLTHLHLRLPLLQPAGPGTAVPPAHSMAAVLGSTTIFLYVSGFYTAARSPGASWRHLCNSKVQRGIRGTSSMFKAKTLLGYCFLGWEFEMDREKGVQIAHWYFWGWKAFLWLSKHFLKLFSSGLFFPSGCPEQRPLGPQHHS